MTDDIFECRVSGSSTRCVRKKRSVHQTKRKKKSKRLKIIIKAKKEAINIKSFRSLYNQYQESEIKQKIFKNATDSLFKLVDRVKLPRYIADRELIQLMVGSKYYLKQGESGFERFIGELYGGIIYDIICKLIPEVFSDLVGKNYIGRTHKSKFERMMEHVEASLNPYKNHTRKIEKAIITALKQEYNIYLLWEQYYRLSYGMKRKELQKLTKLLLDKYFDVDIIEVHKNYYTTYKREEFYIKSYKHYVNGKLTIGTKDPNGLNMVISSGPLKYISLPLYDIAFMIALGYRPKLIAKILNKNYNLGVNNNIVNARIREFWQSWENAQEKFLKPVVQALIEQNKYSYSEIKDSFKYSHKGFYKVFKRFFKDLNFNQLKMVMARKNFDWESLKQIAEDYKDDKKIRGISLFKWKEWFVKGVPLGDLAELTGFKSENGIKTFLNKDEKAIIEFGGGGYEKIVDKFRRERTIECLLDLDENKDLEWIYVNDFGLNSRDDYKVDYHFDRQLAAFFERLFDFKLTIDELKSRDPKMLQNFKN